ncbi:MAG TPA: ABC transporter permease [Bacillota bacterium]|nr:ABC transporter permease [Bacillota bacterium]
MIQLIQTRWMHIRNHYKSLFFWLLLPLFATTIFTTIDTTVEDQLRIPVGIVTEDKTPLLQELLESIEDIPHVDVHYVSYEEGMHQLENHQLDSMYVFPEHYDDSVHTNERRGIVSQYTSNISFAAIPVRESIVSFIQEQLNRSKAANTIEKLFQTHHEVPPTKEEVAEISREIQANEKLIETTLLFSEEHSTTPASSFISMIDIWVIFTLFSTMMIFEWVVRERNHPTYIRVNFTNYQPKKYAIYQLMIYLFLFILVDLCMFAVLTYGMDVSIRLFSMVSMIVFRITIVCSIFLLALLFKQRFSYLMVCVFLFILLIGTSGMILPIDGILRHFPLFATLHPLQPVIHGEISYVWLIFSSVMSVLWLVTKEDIHAKSS